MKKKSLVTLILGVAFLVAALLPAQMEPAPYVTIHYDRINPEQMMAWEENGKDWVEAFSAAKAGSDNYWNGYQSGFTYAWVSEMPNYAYLDDTDAREKMLVEKLGEGKLEELEAGAEGAVVEHHNEIWKYQADLTYAPEGFSNEGMGAVNVTTVTVKPSKGEEYRGLVKEVVAALAKSKAPINFFGYSLPYSKGSYAFVTWAKDRAALHSGPEMRALLTEALGAEKTDQMYADYLKCVADVDERDWRHRPSLSYMSDAEMMEEKEAME